MGKRVKLTKTEKLQILIVFLLHVAFLYLLSNYSKAMETYPDELIYYDMAKCIFEGKSPMVHGVDFQFSKLGYTFVLLPTFLIRDVAMRVHAIMLINAVLMSLSFIPCYLICKELGVSKGYCYLAAILTCIWPDIVISGTFMSENLYFPVTAFAFYYILLSYKYKKKRFIAMVLVLSALAYFTKEIGICLLLAYVATEVMSRIFTIKNRKTENVISNRDANDDIKKSISKMGENANLKRILLCAVIGIAVCLAIKVLFFGGISNSYIKSGALDISYFMDYQVALYLTYGFFYTLVSTVLAFWVLPVFLPIIGYKKLDEVTRKYLLYTVLLTLGSIFVIAVTITAREDFGKAIPGVHLRYLAEMIVPFISIFFVYLSKDGEIVFNNAPERKQISIDGRKQTDIHEPKNCGKTIISKSALWINLLLLLGAGLIFKGIYNTCTTGTIGLQYIYVIRKIVGGAIRSADNKPILYPAGIATVFGLAIFVLIIYLAAKCSKNLAVGIFCGGAVLLSFVNMAIGYRNVYNTYVDDENMIAEMVAIDEYFEENGLTDKNVAFIDESQFSEETKVYDLYFRSADRQYMIPDEDLKNYSGVLVEPIISYAYIPEEIDYFIVTNEGEPFEDMVEGVTLVPELTMLSELTGRTYSVYKNDRR